MPFHHLLAEFEPVLRAHGAASVGVILFLESFGAPLPGELLLVIASVLAARGELSIAGLLAAAWVGAVAGDTVGYLIGRTFGRTLILRYGARVGLTAERFARIEKVFARWGPVAVAFARFFDVLRQLNGIVAGTAGLPWPRFFLFNAFGAALWVGVWGLGAYYFGSHMASATALVRHLGPWGVAAVLAAAAAAVTAVVLVARRTRPKV